MISSIYGSWMEVMVYNKLYVATISVYCPSYQLMQI